MLPADVAAGKVDYIEIVGFSDHKATAAIWYRLLNLGFRLPAGAGTDAMANYASLRGPVGMNRVFLDTRGDATPGGVARGAASGAHLRKQWSAARTRGGGGAPWRHGQRERRRERCPYRIALRSPVPVEHLELVHNGRVIQSFRLSGDRRSFDAEGVVPIEAGGWLLLRAWNDGADPLVLDLYPYATTSPIYLELPGGAAGARRTPLISPPGWSAC